MRYQTLAHWLHWLESCHPQEIELGLDRVSSVAQRLGFSFGDAKVVTVAGTNGKGSCVALLTSLLSAAGLRTAAYTSPHLLHYNERIRIDGEAVSDSQVIAAFDRIDQARENISLTYFEFGTLAALDIFSGQSLDVIILEVGLGGRLDAVNIIDPDIAVITSIALDHQDWLGDDREQIGREKAGIIRRAKPLVCGELDPPGSIAQAVVEVGARLYQRDQQFTIKQSSAGSYSWQGESLDGSGRIIDNLPQPALSIDNVATVLQVLELLNLAIDDADYANIASITLPGRLQRQCYNGRRLILDVAHNPAAAHKLATSLRQAEVTGRTYILLTMMADKDAAGFIAALDGLVDGWYVADLENVPRAMAASELASYIQQVNHQPVASYPSPAQGFSAALAIMGDNDRLLVAGSFLLVAEVMKIINSGEDLNE